MQVPTMAPFKPRPHGTGAGSHLWPKEMQAVMGSYSGFLNKKDALSLLKLLTSNLYANCW